MTLPSQVRWLSLALLSLPFAAGCVGCRHAANVSAKSKSSADGSLPIAPTVMPQRRALAQQLEVAGELLPYQQVELHAKVSGYIKNIYVDIGDRVHTGEDLADLEIPELMAQVQGAQAGVHGAEEDVLRAKSTILRDQATHAALHSEYLRLKQAAAEPGLIAQQELDDAQAKDTSAEAEIEVAKANLSAMQQALSAAKATSAHYSDLADYSHIRAPFNGVVTWRYSDTGALVQAGTSSAGAQPVVKLDETDILRLRLPVPGELAPFVSDGDLAQIRIEDTGQQLTGKVVRTTGSLDPSTRTLQVEIDLKNPGNNLLPGMYAGVTMSVRRSGTGLTLPVQAVDQTTNPPFAFVVDSQGLIRKRDLRLGIRSPTRVEVVSGIGDGDRVLATNLAYYAPGERVNPQPADLPAMPGANGDQ